MSPLFATPGLLAVRRLAARPSLLAFDLDGTLAPLVSKPDDAAVASRTAARLKALARLWPVAVISGRQADDARSRLGFTPRFLYGNHGAQRSGSDGGGALRQQLALCRAMLGRLAPELRAREIVVEDKGLSIALHYRQAADPAAARLWLAGLVPSLDAGIRASTGHCVLNLVPAAAPDKGDALLQSLRESGATAALVIGDDANDEPAFIKAPTGSVSIRIGSWAVATQARFRLSRQSQVDTLLHLLLALRR